MDLSLRAIYFNSFKGVANHLYIYLLLMVWLLVGGIVVFIVMTLGGILFLASLASIDSGSDMTAAIFTGPVMVVLLVIAIMTLLSAGSKAGLLAFGSVIRKGENPNPLVFFRGVIKYTWRLFYGGIIIGMLTTIPILAVLLIARYTLAPGFEEIFTSGWNYTRSFELLRYYFNLGLGAGLVQALVFFWISPWDEMVVFYDKPFPEALQRSFSFVFSKRHFFRVLGVIAVNFVIAQLIAVLTNFSFFIEGAENGLGLAWLRVVFYAPLSDLTPIVQFLFMPLFAYAQLFLLPIADKTSSNDKNDKYITGVGQPLS